MGKACHTVKYMTPRQWFYRGWYALRSEVKLPQSGEAQAREIPLGFAPGKADMEAAEGILRLEFPLVSGLVARFSGEVDWDLPGNDYRLQCFRLNGFDFLHTLSDAYHASGDRRYLDFGLGLISHWQENCAKVKGDKWNPYPLAQRIANWIGFVSTYATEHLGEIAPWISAQAGVLYKSVEYQLGANHLLTEGKALMYAGAFLRDEKLFRQGKTLLEKEYAAQFLPDGGHYEGSLSYHIESLQQYFEAAMLLAFLKDEAWQSWAEKLQKPYEYLAGLLGPEGKIPLFNDSAFDYCANAQDFLATSALIFDTAAPGSKAGSYCARYLPLEEKRKGDWGKPQTRLYPDSGLFVDRFDGHCFYLRCGNLGPDCNLGHAHADQLSILWQTEGGEVFADSGVFTYQSGPLRAACRATAAHNTVEIDGADSAEVWAAFRTARRGHGKVVFYEGSAVTARHDGYRKILGDGLTHERAYRRAGNTVTLTDTLVGKKKPHTAALRFHLAPGCEAELLDDYRARLKGKYILECSEKITLEPCQIAGNFGEIRESLCIAAKWAFQGVSQVKTVITL